VGGRIGLQTALPRTQFLCAIKFDRGNAAVPNVPDHALDFFRRRCSSKHTDRAVQPASQAHYLMERCALIQVNQPGSRRRRPFRPIQRSGLCRCLGIHTGIVHLRNGLGTIHSAVSATDRMQRQALR